MIRGAFKRQFRVGFIKSVSAAWALTALVLFLAYILGGLFFLVSAALGGIAAYHLTPRISPVLVLRLYRGTRLPEDQGQGLYHMVADISRRAGIETVPGIWTLSSMRPIAFATGDRHSSAIALSRGIFNSLDADELVGVVAHELSHIAHDDSRIMWFSEMTVKMVALFSIVGQVMVLISLPAIFAGEREVSLALLAIVFISPPVAMLLQLSLLRTREFAADALSVKLVGSAWPLIRALDKLSGGSHPLFLRWIGGRRGQKGHSLLRTHPPVGERIRRLKQWERERQSVPLVVTEEELMEMLLSGEPGGEAKGST